MCPLLDDKPENIRGYNGGYDDHDQLEQIGDRPMQRYLVQHEAHSSGHRIMDEIKTIGDTAQELQPSPVHPVPRPSRPHGNQQKRSG